MTAISVSERLLEMAAFYTWLDFTLTYKVLFAISFDGYDLTVLHPAVRNTPIFCFSRKSGMVGDCRVCDGKVENL